MAKRDAYEVLGLAKNATDTEIKKAYRMLAIKFHPDKNPDDSTAEDKFKEAAEAYEILSDPDKRARYDRFGHAGMGGAAGGGGGGFGGGMSMDDIFSNFGDIFGGAFGGGGFGGGGGRRGGGQRRMKGSNLRVRIKLNLKEIANGVEKKIKVNKLIRAKGAEFGTCGTCGGSGQVARVTNTFLGQMQSVATCPNCNGSGQSLKNRPAGSNEHGLIREEVVIPIEIPAGVEEGMQLNVSGMGNEAPGSNSVPGDLLVVIEEETHEDLRRDGMHLHHERFVNLADAALGGNLEVPLVDGKAKIKIAAGTQSGHTMRLKGKGLPHVHGGGTGDLFVHVMVWTPTNLSSDEKAQFETMRSSKSFEPNPGKKDKGFFERVKEVFGGG